MMKKRLLVALIASVLMIAAESMNTVNLTVINKSEVDIGLMLNSVTDEDRWYYFTIPSGYPDEPKEGKENYTEQTYEIVWDVYTSAAYFMEPYDPVYGYPNCGNKTIGSRLVATHNVKLVYKACKKLAFHPGAFRELRAHRSPKILAR